MQNCALVLGTSPKISGGSANPYFTSRMNAVAKLYQLHKIKLMIVSGEKSQNYDEPAAMKKFLISNYGISPNAIIEDPKGFNTYQSVIRCKNVFHQENIIIVSQDFHNLRALFLARNERMNAYAFEANDVSKATSYYRNHTREFFARVKAVFFYLLRIM